MPNTSVSTQYRLAMGAMGQALVHVEKVLEHWERHGSFGSRSGAQEEQRCLCQCPQDACQQRRTSHEHCSTSAAAPAAASAATTIATGPGSTCCSSGVAPQDRRALASCSGAAGGRASVAADAAGPEHQPGLAQTTSASLLELRYAVGGHVPIALLTTQLRAMRATLDRLTQLEARLERTTAPASCRDWLLFEHHLQHDLCGHIQRMRATLDSLYPRASCVSLSLMKSWYLCTVHLHYCTV